MPTIRLTSGIPARLLMILLASVLVSLATVLFTTRRFALQQREVALWGATVMGALAAVAVWHGIEVIVLRRVKRVLDATARLRAGDLSARTGLSYGSTELGVLAREFDCMAAALQQQQQDSQRAEHRLRTSVASKAAVLESSLDGVLVLDELGTVMECNAAARAQFGCDGRECVHHRIVDLFPGELPSGASIMDRPVGTFEATGRRLDQTEFPAEVSIASVRDPEVKGLFVATVRDITVRKRLEESLLSMSFQDDLSGAYNRRGFFLFAAQQLGLAGRNGQSVVLVSMDVDGLKSINDDFGHAEGDRAIRELAKALRACFRDTDVIGRIGGDEFVVLITETTLEGAERAIERLGRRIASRNAVGDLPWTLSASVGWLRADASQGAPLAELLARVDERMYSRKRRRRGPPAPSLEAIAPDAPVCVPAAGTSASLGANAPIGPDVTSGQEPSAA